MRRALPATLAAGMLASLAFAPAVSDGSGPDLETVPYIDTDIAGEGNAINGAGLVDETVPETSTGPAQLAEADILGARISSRYDEVIGADGLTDYVLTGLEFRTALSTEPTATSFPLIHRFIGTLGSCTFWVQAYTGTNGQAAHGSATVRLFDAGCGIVDDGSALGGNETVRGDWISYSWDADNGEMVVGLDMATGDDRLTSQFRVGEYYILDYLENRANTGVITAPVFDIMFGGGFATIGADVPADETADA